MHALDFGVSGLSAWAGISHLSVSSLAMGTDLGLVVEKIAMMRVWVNFRNSTTARPTSSALTSSSELGMITPYILVVQDKDQDWLGMQHTGCTCK